MANTNGIFLMPQDMAEVAEVFQGAYENALEAYPENSESRKHLEQFTAWIVLQIRPYMAVSPDGVTQLSTRIFGDEKLRDFVMGLSFGFFSRWGASPERLEGLVNNLAQGLQYQTGDSSYAAMPEQLQQRLPSNTDVYFVLKSNQWLLIVMLMQLFITITAGQRSAS